MSGPVIDTVGEFESLRGTGYADIVMLALP